MVRVFFGLVSKEFVRSMNRRRLSIVLIIIGLPSLGLQAAAQEESKFTAAEIQRLVADLDSVREPVDPGADPP